jgi:hypothetical protein
MRKFVARVTGERLGGGKPGAPRALGAAALAGTAAAVVTYRLLRR